MVYCPILIVNAETHQAQSVETQSVETQSFEAQSLNTQRESSLSETNPQTKIYFYNPEINTASNLVLKNAWDLYLHNFGPYEFQPVDDENSFKQLVYEEQNAAFIMAEWFYSSYLKGKISDLEFVFQGRKHNQDTYRKILISNKRSLDFESITIAASGTDARAREILKSIYPELSEDQLKKLNILLVPKDIDALMAVGYGLAEMALATEVGLYKIEQLNQNLFKDMIVLKESSPLKRSVLIFKSKSILLKTNLARSLVSMPQTIEGQEAMNLLGLDEWHLSQDDFSALLEGPKNSLLKKGGHNNDK